MKLNEVYNSGANAAQGTIKCTFAELYNQDGSKLYSLNKDQLGYNVLVLTDSLPDEKGYVEVALTDTASKAVISSKPDFDLNKITVWVKPDVIDWAPLDESNLPSVENNEHKQSKAMLYIGLGLLALSLIKK